MPPDRPQGETPPALAGARRGDLNFGHVLRGGSRGTLIPLIGRARYRLRVAGVRDGRR
jgi:hypothetical protein